jgi:hypothetical protein
MVDTLGIVEVKNEDFFLFRLLQPQQAFGLRAGMSADHRIQVCNAFQQTHRMLDKRLRIVALALNPFFSPKDGLTKQEVRLSRFVRSVPARFHYS